MDPDFTKRAKAARTPILSKDIWSNPAADMVRVAIFAGFDAKPLIIACLKASRGQKVNIRTVQRVLNFAWLSVDGYLESPYL